MSVNAGFTRLPVRLCGAIAVLAWVAVLIAGTSPVVATATAPIGATAIAPVGATAPRDEQANAGVTRGVATVLEINGAIGPATSRYVTRGLEAAAANGSRIVILQIDTPGGLDTAMRDIIRGILASPVP